MNEKKFVNLDIMQITNLGIELTRKGRNFVCCCPFHNEDTPSFVVNPEKNIATCFGSCNRTWDYIGFYSDYKNISRKEAFQEITGCSVVKPKSKPLKMLDYVQEFYRMTLSRTETGKKVIAYFKKRGFTEEEINSFNIGFSAGETDKLLKDLGYYDLDIYDTGIFNEQLKDSFKGRITFPLIEDKQVLGYTCRQLYDNPNFPKYLNSKETAFFKKNETFFNLDNAINEIKRKKSVIIAEGPVDAMSYYVSGVKNVVATCGVALTQEHLLKLKQYTNHIILAFDMDSAGQNAIIKAFKMAKQMSFEVSIISLKKAKDANEFMIKFGRNKLANFANKTISIYNVLFKKNFEKNKELIFELLNLETVLTQKNVLKGIASISDFSLKELLEEFTMFQQNNEERFFFECIVYQCMKSKSKINRLKKIVNIDLFTVEEKQILNDVFQKKEVNSFEENYYEFDTLILNYIQCKMKNLN